MKKRILQVLTERGDKGSTTKKLASLLSEGDEKVDTNELQDVLVKLVKYDKIRQENDKYYDINGKRKAGNDSSGEVGDVENSSREKSKNKKMKQDHENDSNVIDSTNKSNNNSNKSKSLKGMYPDLWRTGEQLWRENGFNQEYLLQNPDNITRLFCGNLNKNITEEQLHQCIENIVYIKWITDKETQQFYGSTFLELKDAKSAATAVMKDKQKFLGRPLKIYYCPPRPGDIWPPKHDHSSSSNGGGGVGGSSTKPPTSSKPPIAQLSEKPSGCRKLYCGNLSYNIDDDTIVEFFKDCGVLIGLRWLTHKDSGEFKGCGFVEFETTEQADAAIKLNGKELLGR